jgi:hypothetical protein
MKRLAILIALALVLIPSTVSADELWVKNEGGLEVTIDYSGAISAEASFFAFNPNYAAGQAKLAAVTLTPEWVVIRADNITGWDIYHCNQSFESVAPVVRFVDEPALVVTTATRSGKKGKKSSYIRRR